MKRKSIATVTPPNFIARAALLLALLLALAPQLSRMPLLLGALCAGLWGWRALHDFTGSALPGNLMRFAITTVSIAAVIISYRTLLGRDAGVSLLTIMLCLKLMEMRSERDAMLSAFLGYFLGHRVSLQPIHLHGCVYVRGGRGIHHRPGRAQPPGGQAELLA